MKVTFLGGASEVGASCTLLEIGNSRILVDAGIRISPKASRGLSGDQLPDLNLLTNAGHLDAILITHAHTDHIGALPLVVERYPDTPIYATAPTIALIHTLLVDAHRIMTLRHYQEGELPLFDPTATELLLKAIQPIDFGQVIKISPDAQAVYHIAGHIVGAGMISIDTSEGLLFLSGDLSMTKQRMVTSAAPPSLHPSWMILESTYGGRLHANRAAEEHRLVQTLRSVIDRGGQALIPAFALGRAQELIQILLAYQAELPVPIYIDGMVRSVCDTYARYQDLLPTKTVMAAGDSHLFFRGNVRSVKSRESRYDIVNNLEPCIIIASSGMLTGGASTFYAHHLAPRPDNAILFTGYQDEESPGRFLQTLRSQRDKGEIPVVHLAGKPTQVRCTIDTYSLSAHADEAELVNMTLALDPQQVFLVHGDNEARASLAEALTRRNIKAHLPHSADTITLKPSSRVTPLHFTNSTSQSTHPAKQLLLQEFPTLPGQLIVLRMPGERPRAGVALRVYPDAFEALTTKNAPHTLYPQAALIWALGPWRYTTTDYVVWRKALHAMSRQAIELIPTLLPAKLRSELKHSKTPINLPDLLHRLQIPSHIDRQIAELGIALALAADGAARTSQGLIPGYHPPMPKPTDKASISREIEQSFPEAAGLRKVTVPKDDSEPITLHFTYPDLLTNQHTLLIRKLESRYKRTFQVHPHAHLPSLLQAFEGLKPPKTKITKKPGVYQDQRLVTVGIDGVTEQQITAISQTYLQKTGFTLQINPATVKQAKAPEPGLTISPDTGAKQINDTLARDLIKQTLLPFGLVKLTYQNNQFTLYYAVPDMGYRTQSQLQALANQTGYSLRVHPHENTQAVLTTIHRLALINGLTIQEKISLYQSEKRAVVRLLDAPAVAAQDNLIKQVNQELGYLIEFDQAI